MLADFSALYPRTELGLDVLPFSLCRQAALAFPRLSLVRFETVLRHPFETLTPRFKGALLPASSR
jgi:hypothetical protein